MFDSQSRRRLPGARRRIGCLRRNAPAQLTELKVLWPRRASRTRSVSLDMVLLTVGANDVNFAGLVANVIVDGTTERVSARAGRLHRQRAGRAKTLLDGDLPERIRPIAHGAQAAGRRQSGARRVRLLRQSGDAGGGPALPGRPRRSRRAPGVFGADPSGCAPRPPSSTTSSCPTIKMLATCDGENACRDPMTDRMTFVDAHQAAFDQHGMCVHAPNDPDVRSAMLFAGRQELCDRPRRRRRRSDGLFARPASDYRPYASRARWIRTANDSYFTAMTYPVGIPAMLRPSDIHDAMWGVLSAVYGGAMHPTAEGYAAMADAAMPAVRVVLGLPQPPAVSVDTLPPPTSEQPSAPSPADLLPQRPQRRRHRFSVTGAGRRAAAHALSGNSSSARRRDSELLLQARRRRGVLEHQPLVRIDVVVTPSAPSAPPHGSRRE